MPLVLYFTQFVDLKIPPRGPYFFPIFVAPTKQILMESGNWIPNIISARHEIQFVQIVNQKQHRKCALHHIEKPRHTEKWEFFRL